MAAASPAVRRIGRYALFRPIAAGGMATIHLGRLIGPVGFARTVAIKRLHEHYASDPEFVSMFLDEARLAARIHHPNVVATLDVVALEEELFIVMEYVHGDSLSRLLRAAQAKPTPIDPKVAASIVGAALHGLHAAHEAVNESGRALAIVHRDVSPQNILVGADGVVRVLDFGVAKAVNRLHSTHGGGELKGKFRYMAPEQIRNEPVDRRADIYAAGIVLFEALTGGKYTDADDPAAIVFETVTRKPVPPSARRPDLSPEIDAVTLKALAVDPDDRYATAEEFALALEDAIGVASPAKIGRWVAELARSTLDERAKQVAETESSPDARPTSSLPPPLRPDGDPISRPSLQSLQSLRNDIETTPDPTRMADGDHPVEMPSVASNVSSSLSVVPENRRRARLTLAGYGALGAVCAAVIVGAFLLVTDKGRASDDLDAGVAAATSAGGPPGASSESTGAGAGAGQGSDGPAASGAPLSVASSSAAPPRSKPGSGRHPVGSSVRPAPSSDDDIFRKRR